MIKKLNLEYIEQLLVTKDKHVIGRALVALNKRQTEDEQRTKNTRCRNGRGFRPSHAYMGTSMAQFYERREHLTDKQIRYWTKPTQKTRGPGLGGSRHGPMVSRISIYSGQLLKVAEIKQGMKNCPYHYEIPKDTFISSVRKWCKENIAGEWFVNPENPMDGIWFADEGDKVLCGLKWS